MVTHLVISDRYDGLNYHLRINTSEITEKSLVDFPNRIYFFVTSENFGDFLEIQIEFYGLLGIEIKEFTLPFVKVIDGKYFYSGISQYVKSFALLTSTPTPTPTPTPIGQFNPPQDETPTPTLSPTTTILEQEPIYDYIYDNMEAVSITGSNNDGSSAVGYNDRSLTTIQGVNGVTGLSIANNIVTLTEHGRYYLKARSDAWRPGYVFTSIKFLSGDYADQVFDGPQRWGDSGAYDLIVTENSVVVDITQTTTFKIQTNVRANNDAGLNHGGATLFVQKLASVDGGGSSSSGGSGSLDIIKSKNSFYTELPDAIIANDTSNGGTRILYLTTYGDGLNISYHNNDSSKNYYMYFNKDDADGATLGAGSNISKASPFDTLRGYIENDRAIYFGGTSSSSGSSSTTPTISNTTHFKNTIVTTQDIPDALVVDCDGFKVCFILDQVTDAQLKWSMNGTGSSNFNIRFTNVADPVFDVCTYPDHGIDSSDKLFDLISEGTIDAVYFGGTSSSDDSSTINVVSAIIEGDGTITSSSDDWIESVAVGDGFMTINFVSNYFTQAPSIALSIDHQDSASHMNIEHNALTKDSVQIIQRGSGNSSYTTLGQFTIIAQHQDRVGGSSSTSASSSSSNNSSTSSVLGVGIGNLDYIKTLYGTGVSDSGVDDIKLRFTEQIPDAIVAKDGDGDGAYWDLILRLTDIGIYQGKLQAWYVRNDYYVYFDLNTEIGNYVNSSKIDISEFKTNAGLKDYIDEGRALYYGGSSSSSPSTILSSSNSSSPATNVKLKEYIDNFSDLGFDIPDAIISMDKWDRMIVLHLQFVNNDSTSWNFIYRGLYASGSDYHVRFTNFQDGPSANPNDGVIHSDFSDKNLKWYIDNGYAVYLNGSSSSGSSSSGGISTMEAVSIKGGAGESSSLTGYNDRTLDTIHGVNGVNGLALENNIVTLTIPGRYYIQARSGSYVSEWTSTAIYFISGDYETQRFESQRRWCNAGTNSSDIVVTESSVVVDITQTTTFKIETYITKAKSGNGLSYGGGASLFVQKLANVDGSSSSSNSSPDDDSRIAPTVRKLIENFKQNNLDIELPEGIIVNWDNKDTILPLMSADKNYIWYGETIKNVVVLKRFKNQKTNNNYGVSNNWGPVGDKEISDWDKSASLKDYIDSNKIK